MISAILREDSVMPSMVRTTSLTILPQLSGTSEAELASLLACCAFSVFLGTAPFCASLALFFEFVLLDKAGGLFADLFPPVLFMGGLSNATEGCLNVITLLLIVHNRKCCVNGSLPK